MGGNTDRWWSMLSVGFAALCKLLGSMAVLALFDCFDDRGEASEYCIGLCHVEQVQRKKYMVFKSHTTT
jgi:hypothetical protein